jgi:cytidylate kinase
MAIIAISRQMGSGGYTIAAAVAKALRYEYVDRQMIVSAVRTYDVPEAAITDVAERRLSAWQRFDEEKVRYRTFLEAAFFDVAEKDNVVTAGRGIAALVRGVSHALRVRIIAPLEVRVERIMKKDNLDHAKAVHKIRAYDRDVTARISYLFGPEWLLPENYDLVINTVRDDPALYADAVAAMASHSEFVATPASTQLVRNLSLAAKVRAAIAANPHTRSGAHLEVSTDKGHLSLKGSVRHLSIREAVLRVAKDVPGVLSVSGEEVTVAYYHPTAV